MPDIKNPHKGGFFISSNRLNPFFEKRHEENCSIHSENIFYPICWINRISHIFNVLAEHL
ncbi:hypothetical protein BRW84_04760 [Oxalobacter formigenes OXCC13]|nr:hypothetical protein BRW84_04760 [Oxalobacter formigenes OXCC13]